MCVASVALRATDVRRIAFLDERVVLRFVFCVRVAARDGVVTRVAVGVAVRSMEVRDAVFAAVRAEICFVAGVTDVRDAFETVAFARGVVARSRKVCVCLAVAFVMRVIALPVVEISGVSDFFRVDVIVFVSPRRVAARTASSESVAHTSPNPSNARHTAKNTLVPFILMCDSVANLRILGQAKYVLIYRIFV